MLPYLNGCTGKIVPAQQTEVVQMSVSFHMRHHRGYTLIELLTVMGIIALMAAILFPVVAAARERGRRISCQNNLKQLALGIQMYVQDNGGRFSLPFSWERQISPYVKNKQVFACPDNPHDYPGTASLYDMGVEDYDYDDRRLDLFLPPYPTKNIQGASEATLPLPADTWLNSDESWTDGAGAHYLKEVTTSCGRTIDGNTLHSGGGNYSFVDGHVEWLTPERFGSIECAAGPLPAPFKD